MSHVFINSHLLTRFLNGSRVERRRSKQKAKAKVNFCFCCSDHLFDYNHATSTAHFYECILIYSVAVIFVSLFFASTAESERPQRTAQRRPPAHPPCRCSLPCRPDPTHVLRPRPPSLLSLQPCRARNSRRRSSRMQTVRAEADREPQTQRPHAQRSSRVQCSALQLQCSNSSLRMRVHDGCLCLSSMCAVFSSMVHMIPASYYAPQQETDSKEREQRAQMDG